MKQVSSAPPPSQHPTSTSQHPASDGSEIPARHLHVNTCRSDEVGAERPDCPRVAAVINSSGISCCIRASSVSEETLQPAVQLLCVCVCVLHHLSLLINPGFEPVTSLSLISNRLCQLSQLGARLTHTIMWSHYVVGPRGTWTLNTRPGAVHQQLAADVLSCHGARAALQMFCVVTLARCSSNLRFPYNSKRKHLITHLILQTINMNDFTLDLISTSDSNCT